MILSVLFKMHFEVYLVKSDYTILWLAPEQAETPLSDTKNPAPGFTAASIYHTALSCWAPLTDNERRQRVQLQAKHSAFYRPKHVARGADSLNWIS